MSTFENGQKRRKVDVLGDGCVNKRCCIWDTLHRIKISEHYDVPFFCYLGFKVADVFPTILYIHMATASIRCVLCYWPEVLGK